MKGILRRGLASTTGLSTADSLSVAALCAVNLVTFGAGVTHLGFYYDDAGFLNDLPSAGLTRLWQLARGYVPGRNLHMVWQYLLFKLVVDPVARLPALHLLQSALDALIVTLFFLLLRRLRLSTPPALLAAGLFSFWPLHGETHYWLSAAPQNQFSTLFILLFLWTSLARFQHAAWTARWWFWLLDGAAFLCALFTYDQVVFVLLEIAVLRVAATVSRHTERFARFAAAHLPHLAALGFYLSVKLGLAPEKAPALTPQAWSLLKANVPTTLSYTAGKLWWFHVAAVSEWVTSMDYLLALLVTLVITGLAIWLLLAPSASAPEAPPPACGSIFLAALLFYVAAYLPIWVWYMASRHHYLPSIGLFVVVAVCLHQAFARIPSRALHFLTVLFVAAVAFKCAAACRAESRSWEASFTAKKQLFAELKPHLAGKRILVLERFPVSLGVAPLIVLHDALFGPRLFYGNSIALHPNFVGDLSSAPAPGGIFLSTSVPLAGTQAFRYYPTDQFLVVRFLSWQGARLHYQINPIRPLPGRLLVSNLAPSPGGPFAVESASARRDGAGVTARLTLHAQLPPTRCLTATLGFDHAGFHYWGERNGDGALNLLPVLLSEPNLPAGSYRWQATLSLPAFPQTDRIRLHFFTAGPDQPPLALGRSELPVDH